MNDNAARQSPWIQMLAEYFRRQGVDYNAPRPAPWANNEPASFEYDALSPRPYAPEHSMAEVMDAFGGDRPSSVPPPDSKYAYLFKGRAK